MAMRPAAPLIATVFLLLQVAPGPARADNQMGYRLLSQQEAASLPRNGGALGLDVERAQQITDGGMTFDLIRVKAVRRGSPGAQAGFNVGDQIIAIDGRVFPTLTTFASYIGATSPGQRIAVDYMPAGGGPQQAQRMSVTIGAAGRAMQPTDQPLPQDQRSGGMSTGTKVAIGVGAAALFGCYEMGCFSHRSGNRPPVRQQVPQSGQYQQQNQYQQPGQYQQPNQYQQQGQYRQQP